MPFTQTFQHFNVLALQLRHPLRGWVRDRLQWEKKQRSKRETHSLRCRCLNATCKSQPATANRTHIFARCCEFCNSRHCVRNNKVLKIKHDIMQQWRATEEQGGLKLTLLWPQVWWRSVQLLKAQQRSLKIITWQEKESILSVLNVSFSKCSIGAFRYNVSNSERKKKDILDQSQSKHRIYNIHLNKHNVTTTVNQSWLF